MTIAYTVKRKPQIALEKRVEENASVSLFETHNNQACTASTNRVRLRYVIQTS